jgi:hypothetical protein
VTLPYVGVAVAQGETVALEVKREAVEGAHCGDADEAEAREPAGIGNARGEVRGELVDALRGRVVMPGGSQVVEAACGNVGEGAHSAAPSAWTKRTASRRRLKDWTAARP